MGCSIRGPRITFAGLTTTLICDNMMGTLFAQGEILKLCLFYDGLSEKRDLAAFVARCSRFSWRGTMMYRSSSSLRKHPRVRGRTATCRPFGSEDLSGRSFRAPYRERNSALGDIQKRQRCFFMTEIKQEMIQWGKLLFDRRLISGWGGNLLPGRQEGFLITGQHAPLGFLTPEDLVQIDHNGKPSKSTQRASSETPLHLAVYRGTDAQAIVHVHPPMVLAFSLTHESFVPISFEENTPSARFPLFHRIRRR